jgi:hypothetical protein
MCGLMVPVAEAARVHDADAPGPAAPAWPAGRLAAARVAPARAQKGQTKGCGGQGLGTRGLRAAEVIWRLRGTRLSRPLVIAGADASRSGRSS